MEIETWDLLLRAVLPGLGSAHYLLRLYVVLSNLQMTKQTHKLSNHKTKLEIEELEQRKRDALRKAWDDRIKINSLREGL